MNDPTIPLGLITALAPLLEAQRLLLERQDLILTRLARQEKRFAEVLAALKTRNAASQETRQHGH
jgi:hypothetical protein